MNIRWFLSLLFILIMRFSSTRADVTEQLKAALGDHPESEYFDKTLPAEIPVKPYEGERYEAEVPDTEELIDYANRGLNAATHMVSAKTNYIVPQVMYYSQNLPVMEQRDEALIYITPKLVEAMPLMRAMTGNNENLEVDGKIIANLVKVTGIDGLVYQPVENKPWVFCDPINKAVGKPWAMLSGEGRQLRDYAMWYQHDHNPLWKKLADRKIKRLFELSVQKDGTRFLRAGRGYSPWYQETGAAPMIATGDVGQMFGEMTGTAAGVMGGWLSHGLITWYRVDNNQKALELATGLARYMHQYGQLAEENTGRLLAPQDGGLSHGLLGTLITALAIQDRQIIKWVNTAVGVYLRAQDKDKTGIIYPQLSSPEDVLQMATLLSLAGYADHWEDADRMIRNSMLITQVMPEDVEQVKSQPAVKVGDPNFKWENLIPMPYYKWTPESRAGLYNAESGPDASVGSCVPMIVGRGTSTGDASYNRWRMYYTVWQEMLEAKDGQIKINLLFNRASPQADIDSYIPYEGKLVVKLKTKLEKVLIRIPQWTDWNAVSCQINGKAKAFQWSMIHNGYIEVENVEAGDQLVVQFPMKTWVVTTNFGFKPGEQYLGKEVPQACKVTLKGNTVIDISDDIGYPVQFHKKFKADKAPMRKVTRFVTKESFIW